jgi:hypothetical protein
MNRNIVDLSNFTQNLIQILDDFFTISAQYNNDFTVQQFRLLLLFAVFAFKLGRAMTAESSSRIDALSFVKTLNF